MKNISNKILIAYFCIVSGVFPLFFTNYYYNIQLSKSLFFIIVTWIAFVTVLISQKEHPLVLFRRCLRSPAQLAFLLFGIFIALSAVLSAYGRSAFTGEDGRYIGAYMLLSMCMCFILFTRQYIDLKPFHTVFLGAGTTAALLGILQFMRVDPLGFSAHVPAQLTGTYLSTIGNINVFSSYLSIIAVFCSGVHHMTGKKSLLPCLFVCFLALFCANSDGGFAATIAVFLLSPLLGSPNTKTLSRLAEQFFAFSLSCIVSRAIAPLAITAYTGLPAFYSSPAFFIPTLSAAALFYSLIKKSTSRRKNIVSSGRSIRILSCSSSQPPHCFSWQPISIFCPSPHCSFPTTGVPTEAIFGKKCSNYGIQPLYHKNCLAAGRTP